MLIIYGATHCTTVQLKSHIANISSRLPGNARGVHVKSQKLTPPRAVYDMGPLRQLLAAGDIDGLLCYVEALWMRR